MFELNNLFVFHGISAVDVQSTAMLLKLKIFLPVVKKLDLLSMYLLMLRIEVCLQSRKVSALCFSATAEYNTTGSIPGRCGHLCQTHKSECSIKSNRNFAQHTFDIYEV